MERINCAFILIRDKTWKCSQCGRVVASPSGQTPDASSLSPCGWKPEICDSNGHKWIERYDESHSQIKRFICGYCGQFINVDRGREDLMSIIDAVPACKAPRKPPQALYRAANYAAAMARWIAAGRPVRGDNQVKNILDTRCRPCRHFDPQRQICKLCGCSLNLRGEAWRNKLRMATEACPDDPPKWQAEANIHDA